MGLGAPSTNVLYPGSSTFPGSTTFPGGGDVPQVEVLFTQDDPGDPTPNWTYAHHGLNSQNLRTYSVDRGRGSERSDIDAGTAEIVLDNRVRQFDPNATGLLPMDRWWIRIKYAGVTQDRFVGYADSYSLAWPEAGKDATCTVSCTDELKVLNLQRTPALDPADASDYPAVIGADKPDVFYRWESTLLSETKIVEEEPAADQFEYWIPGTDTSPGYWYPYRKKTVTVEVGQSWVQGAYSGYGQSTETPIVGNQSGGADGSGITTYGCLLIDSAGFGLSSNDATAGDMLQSTKGTVECWFNKSSNPISNTAFWVSPEVSGIGTRLWNFQLNNAGTVSFITRVTGGTILTSTSGVLNNDTWYHLVGVRDGTNQILYVNGVQVASAASTAAWEAASTSVLMFVQRPGAPAKIAEMAVYVNSSLSASRVLAHYQAGTQRGYVWELPHVRIGNVLDTVGSFAPRTLRTATRTMESVYTAGAPALVHIRAATVCEAPDGMFFADRSGTLTFLDAAHRSGINKWNIISLVFDDDGTDLRYIDTEQVLDESSIVNTWNVAKASASKILQTATDQASKDRYFEREQGMLDLPLRTNADAGTIAAALLSKYKDALERIPQVLPDMNDPAVLSGVLAAELGDKVRVIRRPNPISSITQDGWIQSIKEQGKPGEPLRVTLGISPV